MTEASGEEQVQDESHVQRRKGAVESRHARDGKKALGCIRLSPPSFMFVFYLFVWYANAWRIFGPK
jgi:hypothetical protein